jgi:hypothetical protein
VNNVAHEKKQEIPLIKHSTSISCYTWTLTALSHGLDNCEINDSAQGQFAEDEQVQRIGAGTDDVNGEGSENAGGEGRQGVSLRDVRTAVISNL